MSKQQETVIADWTTEPTNLGLREKLDRSGFFAYITGTGTNGKRYCRTVELDFDDVASQQKFNKIFDLVRTLGPSVFKELVEGEDLPSEAEMPLLTVED